jgi:hypothetical protein
VPPLPGRRYGLTVDRPVNRRVHVGPVEYLGEAADPCDGRSWVFRDERRMLVVQEEEEEEVVERLDPVR